VFQNFRLDHAKQARKARARLLRAVSALGGDEIPDDYITDDNDRPISKYRHNISIFEGIDPNQMIDRTFNASSSQFAHLPHVDVDENIGLMLMTGMSKSLTLRERLSGAEHLRKGGKIDKVDAEAMPRSVVEYLRGKAAEGKEYAVIVVRFPNTTYKNQHEGDGFNITHGQQSTGHWLRIPIVVKTHAKEIVNRNYEDNEWLSSTMTDEIAQQCGFANVRCMQNSRPIGMNNSRNQPKDKTEAETQRDNTLARLHAQRDLIVGSKELDGQGGSLYELKKEKSRLTRALEDKDREQYKRDLQTTNTELNTIRRQLAEAKSDTDASRRDVKELKKTKNHMNGVRRQLEAKIQASDYKAQNRGKFTAELEIVEEKIAKATEALATLDREIAAAESTTSKPPFRFQSDIDPKFLTYEVAAADITSFISMAKTHDKTGAGNDRTQDLYAQTYEHAMQWLEKVKAGNLNGNYLGATREYFETMAQKKGVDIKTYFASDPTFLAAEKRLEEGSKSAEELSARARAAAGVDRSRLKPKPHERVSDTGTGDLPGHS